VVGGDVLLPLAGVISDGGQSASKLDVAVDIGARRALSLEVVRKVLCRIFLATGEKTLKRLV
jgi:hypothetical protein